MILLYYTVFKSLKASHVCTVNIILTLQVTSTLGILHLANVRVFLMNFTLILDLAY